MAVITGFCRDSFGGALVQRGDYRILKSDDDQVIYPSQFGTILQAGMTVEMSIVLREQAEERWGGEEHRCPRCGHINRKVITSSGWVDWYDYNYFICMSAVRIVGYGRKCGGQFHISSDDNEVVSPVVCALYHLQRSPAYNSCHRRQQGAHMKKSSFFAGSLWYKTLRET